ncbi:MAG: hypothetical protein ACXVC1_01065 [Tumebacillaceae bacterium]
MSETTTQIQVQNPALIAAFTPLVSTFPMTWINVGHHLTPALKPWVMGGIAIVYVVLLILFIRLGLKKNYLVLQADGMKFSTWNYSLDQLELISYNTRTRYLKVKTSQKMRGFNVYLGKQDEVPEKLAILKSWAQQTGVRFEG